LRVPALPETSASSFCGYNQRVQERLRMFPKKELSRIERKKRVLVAHSDLLRDECAGMWSAVEGRARLVERRLFARTKLHPMVGAVATAGLLFLKIRYLSRGGSAGSLLSMAGTAMASSRHPAMEDDRRR